MSKTPYELRFDVLSMARDLCMDEYHQKSNAFWQIHQSLEQAICELGNSNTFAEKQKTETITEMYNLSAMMVESIPTMPTSDQINRRAKELYEFVESK